MASVMTRAKPNCFNALHQLRRRLKLGESVTQIIGSYEAGKAPKNIFGMTPAESAAVVNLVHHIPQVAQEVFAKAVCEFGMVKGPITHAGIAAPCMRVNFEPDLIADDWSKHMVNTTASLELTALRIVEDFRAAPPGLRKPAGAPEVARATRICKCWELVLSKLRALIPPASFDSEKDRLTELFKKRSFDDWLFSLTEECPAELDISKCGEFAALVAKNRASIEKDCLI